MSLFISFEGGEGTGKSTQARRLNEYMIAHGHKSLLVHEPGGTDLGEFLRPWLKSGNKPLIPEAELFLFVAARSEFVRRVVRPTLDSETTVIADRYADSTTAYQGYGRRLPMKYVRSANELATNGLWPDLTVLLDAPPEIALLRARVQSSFDVHGKFDQTGRAQESNQRRFEEASFAFHQRVRQGFLKLAAREPHRWMVLDASLPEQSLAEQVWERVTSLVTGPTPHVTPMPLQDR